MSNMEKDNIVKIELEDNDMDMIAGGVYTGMKTIKYTCSYCGQTNEYKNPAGIRFHLMACSKNPNNK